MPANVATSHGDDDEEDAFAMFGDDDNDEPEPLTVKDSRSQQRETSNGVMVFHSGTEQAMLQFVRNSMMDSSNNVDNHNNENQLDRAISLVDEFCFARHWMMHIGDEKGRILDEFVADRAQAHSPNQTFVVVEVGTYCGYSTARIARVLQQYCPDRFHIITVDVDPRHIQVAQHLLQLAGLISSRTVMNSNAKTTLQPQPQDLFTFIVLDGMTSLASRVKMAMKNILPNNKNQEVVSPSSSLLSASLVFLDHDKDFYLSDLQQLEHEGIVRAQTAVAADNVVHFQLEDYRKHVQALAEQGIVSTRLVLGSLEYVLDEDKQAHNNDWQDGLELTIYHHDIITS